MPNVTEVLERPISMKLQTMILSGLVLLVASGFIGMVAAQANSIQRLSDGIAANTVQISNLINETKEIKDNAKGIQNTFVTQAAFLEFQNSIAADRQQTHDFQVRIDNKTDLIITNIGSKALSDRRYKP